MRKLRSFVLLIIAILIADLVSYSSRNDKITTINSGINAIDTTIKISKKDTSNSNPTNSIATKKPTKTFITQEDNSTISKPTNTFKYPSKIVLPVKNIQQMPELPAGCEITSTTMVLNYYGFNVSKMDMLKYLPIVEAPNENGVWASPWEVFVGNPKLNWYGCYSPVIKKTINNYWKAEKVTGYEVEDLSHLEFVNLYGEIEKGNPVIIWASVDMVDINTDGDSWILKDGSKFNWTHKEHCLVLIGFDAKEDTVTLSDPWNPNGTVEYPRATVQKVYEQMGKQALVIHKI